MKVSFVPPLLHAPRHTCVSFVQPLGEDAWLVGFEAVGTREQAEQLLGSFCLVERRDVPEGFDLTEPWDGTGLNGFAVIDEDRGLLGQVEEVRAMPAQDLLVVRGSAGELLIPVVDEFVRAIDAYTATVTVRVPQSLLDINASASAQSFPKGP